MEENLSGATATAPPAQEDATISPALLKKLATDFSRDPLTGAGMIRKLFEAAPSQFTRAAVEALITLEADEEPPGMKFVADVLFAQPDCLATICNPVAFSVEQSRQVVKRLKKLNPSTGLLLSRLLAMLSASTEAEAQFAMRVLEVLDDGRIPAAALPALRGLTRCPNDEVRCKAALLIGRIPKNPQWAEQKPQADGQARASAIEALWGWRTPAASEEFRKALSEPSHRVAANGAVGLYLAGEAGSFAALLRLAERDEPPFRAAAAWAMGRTEDPRFQKKIAQMLEDPVHLVRQSAFRALGSVRLKVKRLKSGRSLEVKLQPSEAKGVEQRIEFSVTRDGAPVGGLGAREFVVFDGEELVEEFTVEPQEASYRIFYSRPDPAAPTVRTIKLQVFSESGAGEASLQTPI